MDPPAPRPGASAPARVRVLRAGGTGAPPREDRVAVEAPLEIRLGARSSTVLMRTPGEDGDLVRGFLYTEGFVRRAEDIVAIEAPADPAPGEEGNVLEVSFAPGCAPASFQRSFYGSSSCGVCGKNSLAALAVRAEATDSGIRVSRALLGALPERLRAAQALFRETGGVHASGLFTAAGDLLSVHEDVGRHNALDKLVGRALREGRLPLRDLVLLVSGRVGYEIVQKAAVAGLPFLAAVGAPTSVAVDLAARFRMTLVGFLRPDALNCYAGEERLEG
jgi:FdhD protein